MVCNGDISGIVVVRVGGGCAFPGEGPVPCVPLPSLMGSHPGGVDLLRCTWPLLQKQNINLGYGMLI